MNSILFLLRSFGVGGAERQLCLLASGLQQSGYRVRVAVFYAGGPMEQEARGMGIQIIDLKRRGRWDLIPFFFRLVRLVKTEKPDVLHSYLQVPNIWAAFIKIVLPRTKVVWGIRASNVEQKQYGWQWELTDKAESLLAKIPDWIICNSKAGMDHAARNGYPVAKMSVIPNGIDRQRFFPNRQAGLKLREEWGIEADQKLIGMVGRLDPMKDYPNFLRTAALLSRERSDVRFVCVGSGPDQYTREVRDLSRSLHLDSCLRWAGERNDLPDIYNTLDVMVLSSAYGEGFSNVLGEAMACGTPCVATDVGDAAQLIGSLGEIVPQRDPEALKRGILALLDRLERDKANLKKEAEQRIASQFSAAKLVST
ncbi:MAG TPA: glycosyltransferase, partial [Anaerolineales bacterium]|nr:glycosyltransferase [Anaerolineales bacterium]